jgi:TolA-binding protein
MGGVTGCSVDNARNHYVLAEKLWNDRNYVAAVSEFEKVTSKDPKGPLGLQAMYRAAMTQELFLEQHHPAVQKLRRFVQNSTDSKLVWNAQLQIGEILFNKTEQYDQVIQHYSALLKQRPNIPEASEFYYRIGKSYFYLFQFTEALEVYNLMIKNYPGSQNAIRAQYEIGNTYFTRGEQSSVGPDSYQLAIQVYEKFIKSYPKHPLAPEAKFGIASCLEELDRLDDAFQAFAMLKDQYPSRNVIEIKLIRIKERMAQRKSSH